MVVRAKPCPLCGCYSWYVIREDMGLIACYKCIRCGEPDFDVW